MATKNEREKSEKSQKRGKKVVVCVVVCAARAYSVISHKFEALENHLHS